MIYCDFHTHWEPEAPEIRALVSVPRLPAVRRAGSFYSLQLHPWDLPEECAVDVDFVTQAAAADALGETGLDRVRGAEWERQQRAFEGVLQLAAELRKPVVIHCVRAFPEVAAQLRYYGLDRVLFHGVAPGSRLAAAVWEAGYLASSGRGLLPGGGLETDDGARDIRVLYEQYAAGRETELQERFEAFLADARQEAGRTR